MNEGLINRYLSMPKVSTENLNKLKYAKCDIEYISLLNEILDGNWTYEIIKEQMYGVYIHISIVLYIPGNIKIGTGFAQLKENENFRFNAIRNAIKNACEQMKIEKNTEKNIKETKENSSEFTEEQRKALNTFVKKYAIINDDMFLKYLQVWNPNIKEKKELNSSNVNDFLEMIENISNITE